MMSASLPPTTRYQGSKRKLISWISECLGDRATGSVLDLMSGTASVAYYFKREGCRVACNDYIRCNYMTAIALVENSCVTLGPDDIDFLLQDGEDHPSYTFIRDNFRGFYFTDPENTWLDKRIARIDELATIHAGDTLKYKRALAFHALSQAALMKRPFNLFHRKNLDVRTNEVARSFGNKTTWERPFEELFRRLCDESNRAVFDNGMQNLAYNELAEDLDLSEAFDLVYVDPPYFAQQRERACSDYRFLYHFIEGMARYREWPNLIDWGDARLALRRDYEEGSPYVAPPSELANTLVGWFRSVLSRWRESILVLSYKSPGVPSAEQLVDLMRELKSTVTVYDRPYTYALSRQNGKPRENIELLIVGE